MCSCRASSNCPVAFLQAELKGWAENEIQGILTVLKAYFFLTLIKGPYGILGFDPRLTTLNVRVLLTLYLCPFADFFLKVLVIEAP